VFSPQLDPLTAVLRPGQAFADLCLGDWSDGAAKPRQGTCCMILRIHRKRFGCLYQAPTPLPQTKEAPPSSTPRAAFFTSPRVPSRFHTQQNINFSTAIVTTRTNHQHVFVRELHTKPHATTAHGCAKSLHPRCGCRRDRLGQPAMDDGYRH
jgi:hypothetical protein